MDFATLKAYMTNTSIKENVNSTAVCAQHRLNAKRVERQTMRNIRLTQFRKIPEVMSACNTPQSTRIAVPFEAPKPATNASRLFAEKQSLRQQRLREYKENKEKLKREKELNKKPMFKVTHASLENYDLGNIYGSAGPYGFTAPKNISGVSFAAKKAPLESPKKRVTRSATRLQKDVTLKEAVKKQATNRLGEILENIPRTRKTELQKSKNSEKIKEPTQTEAPKAVAKTPRKESKIVVNKFFGASVTITNAERMLTDSNLAEQDKTTKVRTTQAKKQKVHGSSKTDEILSEVAKRLAKAPRKQQAEDTGGVKGLAKSSKITKPEEEECVTDEVNKTPSKAKVTGPETKSKATLKPKQTKPTEDLVSKYEAKVSKIKTSNAETPSKIKTSKSETPSKVKTSILETPSKIRPSTSEIRSKIKTSNLETPSKIKTSNLKTPSKIKTSKSETPSKIKTSKSETPTKIKTSKSETPSKIRPSTSEIRSKIKTSNLETPSKIQTSNVETPSKIKTSKSETPSKIRPSTSEIRSKVETSKSEIPSAKLKTEVKTSASEANVNQKPAEDVVDLPIGSPKKSKTSNKAKSLDMIVNLENDLNEANMNVTSSVKTPEYPAKVEELKTPVGNGEPGNCLYVSPFVTVSRGKNSARKEYEQRKSSGGTFNSPAFQQNTNVQTAAEYFTLLLDRETKKINRNCEYWTNIKIDGTLSEEAVDMIDVAIGQGTLLRNKKMQSFRNLIQYSLGENEKPVTCTDLHGFWDVLNMQIDNVSTRFENLEKLRDNHWKEILPEKPKKAVVKKVAKPPANVKRSNALRDMIRSQRLRAKIVTSEEEGSAGAVKTPKCDRKSTRNSVNSAKGSHKRVRSLSRTPKNSVASPKNSSPHIMMQISQVAKSVDRLGSEAVLSATKSILKKRQNFKINGRQPKMVLFDVSSDDVFEDAVPLNNNDDDDESHILRRSTRLH